MQNWFSHMKCKLEIAMYVYMCLCFLDVWRVYVCDMTITPFIVHKTSRYHSPCSFPGSSKAFQSPNVLYNVQLKAGEKLRNDINTMQILFWFREAWVQNRPGASAETGSLSAWNLVTLSSNVCRVRKTRSHLCPS